MLNISERSWNSIEIESMMLSDTQFLSHLIIRSRPWFADYMVEKQGIINLNSYTSKSYVSVVLSDSKVAFFQEGEDLAFHSFFIVFCLYTVLHNWRNMSSKFLVFHTSGGISSRPAIFLLLIHTHTHTHTELSTANKYLIWINRQFDYCCFVWRVKNRNVISVVVSYMINEIQWMN